MNQLSDVAAERGVLAGLCTYGMNAYIEVSDLLITSSFTLESNQNLWYCLTHIFKEENKTVDYPTILSAAQSIGLSKTFDKIEEQQHLRAIMNFPVKLENIRKLAAVLKKLEIARNGKKFLSLANEKISSITGTESINEILAYAEAPILEWSNSLILNSEGPKKVGSGLKEYTDYLANNQRDVVGISSGFKLYDYAIGGAFRPGTVNVIGARTKVGKSQKANNIAARVASGAFYNFDIVTGKVKGNNLQVPVLQLDTEMTQEDQWHRQLAMVAQVKVDDIESGKYARNNKDKDSVKKAVDRIENWPYDFLNISGQPFEETISVMRRWVTKTVGLNNNGTAKPCLIIFDYLKLMDSSMMESKSLAEFQVLGFMMTQLHNFAVKYKVPILVFIQLNRDGINNEDTSVASGSDRIVWLCSNFSIYKVKSDEEIAEYAGTPNAVYNRKMVPVVARHGAGLEYGDYINVHFKGEYATILEGKTRKDLEKNNSSANNTNKGIILDDTNGQQEVPFSA